MRKNGKKDTSKSASIDAERINHFIEKLARWGDGLPFQDRAILQLLLSSVDRETTAKIAGGGLVQDVASAARNGLAGILGGGGSIQVGPTGVTAWAKGGPMWAKWSAQTGMIAVNPAVRRRP